MQLSIRLKEPILQRLDNLASSDGAKKLNLL
jgi:predicted DNA-binding protein